MADSDWHLYRRIRGKNLPAYIDLGSVRYYQKRLLKYDFYAAVGLYAREFGRPSPEHPAQVLLKVYHTDSFWGIPLGWLGRWLCRRESQCYAHLVGVQGIPRWLGRYGESGFLREYLAGCNLREFRARQIPDSSYYTQLLSILEAVHAAGLSHNDLSKAENILVRDNLQPGLIDFQIALGPHSAWNWPMRWLIRYMQSVDRYHLMKHFIHDHSQSFSAEQKRLLRRKGWLLWLHGLVLRKPYRAVRHTLVLPMLRTKQQPRKAA
jgi:transposase-like protein